ncbi:VOC family protein [Actinomadura parmotrematis]|uniref:VOC family protein n=1 Tax=Actinomadura parmotrematis TaxID=2864039 RepID=A0ABS7FVU2_9ACTN|nr:VOC family protein [Actinomadura parmotrematis]MBW8483702.1 VOC family protein [Actinomadura parmotrematis]
MTRIGNVLYPVKDVAAAAAFYRDALGLAVKFQDGDRYAALDGGGTAFAIAGPEEDVTGGVPAVSFKVDDVAALIGPLTAAGAEVVRAPEEGPHEVRAALRDPAGNVFVLYASREQSRK